MPCPLPLYLIVFNVTISWRCRNCVVTISLWYLICVLAILPRRNYGICAKKQQKRNKNYTSKLSQNWVYQSWQDLRIRDWSVVTKSYEVESMLPIKQNHKPVYIRRKIDSSLPFAHMLWQCSSFVSKYWTFFLSRTSYVWSPDWFFAFVERYLLKLLML